MFITFNKLEDLPKENSYIEEFLKDPIFPGLQAQVGAQLFMDWKRQYVITGEDGRTCLFADSEIKTELTPEQQDLYMQQMIKEKFPTPESEWLLKHYSQQPSYFLKSAIQTSLLSEGLSTGNIDRVDKIYWDIAEKAIYFEQVCTNIKIINAGCTEEDGYASLLLPGTITSRFKLTQKGFEFASLKIEEDTPQLESLFRGDVSLFTKRLAEKPEVKELKKACQEYKASLGSIFRRWGASERVAVIERLETELNNKKAFDSQKLEAFGRIWKAHRRKLVMPSGQFEKFFQNESFPEFVKTFKKIAYEFSAEKQETKNIFEDYNPLKHQTFENYIVAYVTEQMKDSAFRGHIANNEISRITNNLDVMLPPENRDRYKQLYFECVEKKDMRPFVLGVGSAMLPYWFDENGKIKPIIMDVLQKVNPELATTLYDLPESKEKIEKLAHTIMTAAISNLASAFSDESVYLNKDGSLKQEILSKCELKFPEVAEALYGSPREPEKVKTFARLVNKKQLANAIELRLNDSGITVSKEQKRDFVNIQESYVPEKAKLYIIPSTGMNVETGEIEIVNNLRDISKKSISFSEYFASEKRANIPRISADDLLTAIRAQKKLHQPQGIMFGLEVSLETSEAVRQNLEKYIERMEVEKYPNPPYESSRFSVNDNGVQKPVSYVQYKPENPEPTENLKHMANYAFLVRVSTLACSALYGMEVEGKPASKQVADKIQALIRKEAEFIAANQQISIDTYERTNAFLSKLGTILSQVTSEPEKTVVKDIKQFERYYLSQKLQPIIVNETIRIDETVIQMDVPSGNVLTTEQKKEYQKVHVEASEKQPKWFQKLSSKEQAWYRKNIPDAIGGDWSKFEAMNFTSAMQQSVGLKNIRQNYFLTEKSGEGLKLLSNSTKTATLVPIEIADKEERKALTKLNVEQLLDNLRQQADDNFKTQWGDQAAGFKPTIYIHSLLSPLLKNIGDTNMVKMQIDAVNELIGGEKYKNYHIVGGNDSVNMFRALVRNTDQWEHTEKLIKQARKLFSVLVQNNTNQKKIEPINELIAPLEKLKNTPVFEGRNRRTFKSAMEQLLVERMGGAHSENCKSGKDRTGLDELYKNAMILYYREYKKLPAYDDTGRKRENFIAIFVELYKSLKIHEAAALNTHGAFGIKDQQSSKMLDTDIAKALGEHYVESDNRANLNKVSERSWIAKIFKTIKDWFVLKETPPLLPKQQVDIKKPVQNIYNQTVKSKNVSVQPVSQVDKERTPEPGQSIKKENVFTQVKVNEQYQELIRQLSAEKELFKSIPSQKENGSLFENKQTHGHVAISKLDDGACLTFTEPHLDKTLEDTIRFVAKQNPQAAFTLPFGLSAEKQKKLKDLFKAAGVEPNRILTEEEPKKQEKKKQQQIGEPPTKSALPLNKNWKENPVVEIDDVPEKNIQSI
jgi:hypothetical protein